jgi:transcriptional regulator with XRE-family HTH domain
VTRNDTFAQALRRLREKAGLTQQALADAAGLHRVQVARFEAGRFAPRWDAVQRLADALGVGVNEFLHTPRGKR